MCHQIVASCPKALAAVTQYDNTKWYNKVSLHMSTDNDDGYDSTDTDNKARVSTKKEIEVIDNSPPSRGII